MVKFIGDFIERRPILKQNNQDNNKIFDYLIEEVQEARESSPELLGSELADILWYVHTIAYNEGIDLEKELETKYVRNMYKYPEDQLQEGDYEEVRERLRREWNEKGGDRLFYGLDPKSI